MHFIVSQTRKTKNEVKNLCRVTRRIDKFQNQGWWKWNHVVVVVSVQSLCLWVIKKKLNVVVLASVGGNKTVCSNRYQGCGVDSDSGTVSQLTFCQITIIFVDLIFTHLRLLCIYFVTFKQTRYKYKNEYLKRIYQSI